MRPVRMRRMDDQIRRIAQYVLRVEADRDRDLPALQGLAHRRVEGAVGAGDGVALGVEQTSQRPHPGAADRDQMDPAQGVGQRPTARHPPCTPRFVFAHRRASSTSPA